MGRRGAFVAVVLLCGLVACDDEPTPNIPDPTPSSTSPSVTDSVSPTTPTETPEALTPEETVRAWVSAWNTLLISGDTTPLEQLQTPSCAGCSGLLDPVRQIHEAGGSFAGGDWSIVRVTTLSEESDEVRIAVGIEVAAGATVASAGAEPNEYAASKRLIRYRLVPEAGSWRISVIEVLP